MKNCANFFKSKNFYKNLYKNVIKLNKITSNVDIDNNEKSTKSLSLLQTFLNFINNAKILYTFNQFIVKRLKYFNIKSYYPFKKLTNLFKFEHKLVRTQ